ncbi:MAG: glycosyltransferase family 39 protein [Minisyncoccia bacterium]
MAHTGMDVRETLGITLAAFVLLGASVLFLYHLGREPLQDYDEATYAEVVHEAFVNHDFLSFTYNHQPYFKKPPLLFWLIGVSEELTPSVEAAARLPSALAGIALIAVAMLFAYEVSGNWYGAALAGAALATTAPFLETARESRFDVLVSLFIVLTAYFFFRALANPRWFLLFGFAAGLAVLSKSVIAVFAGVFALCIALFLRRFDWLKNKYFWVGIGVFLLVVLPWHIYETLRFGNAFWQSYIGTEVIARAQQNLFWTVTITNGDYISYLGQFAAPWLWVFFAALASIPFWWNKSQKNERAAVVAFLGTIVSMVAVYFGAVTKAPTYLVPLYPFAALAVGVVASKLFSLQQTRFIPALAAVILVAYAVPFCVYNAYHINPYYSTELQLANEEKIVGQTLADREGTAPLYIYKEDNLGDIKFYGQNLHALDLEPGYKPESGSFLVVGSDATSTLSKDFPDAAFKTLYAGTQVTLFQTL